ncbi:hypothetical protein GCM10022280_11100 [Sphingomonas swuensis]|uniref:Uncharacterized protein n=1 Tax=Sphingomonas swuensis TaxID=977800 RepID=A0ABP7SPH2_9SPHN
MLADDRDGTVLDTRLAQFGDRALGFAMAVENGRNDIGTLHGALPWPAATKPAVGERSADPLVPATVANWWLQSA